MGSVVFYVTKTLPKDTRQFLIVLGINNNAYLSASDMVRPYLLEMCQSNPSWTIPHADEPDVEGEKTVGTPHAKKMRAPASTGPSKKKKVASKLPFRLL